MEKGIYHVNEVSSEHLEDITIIFLADLVLNRFMKENTQLPVPHPIFFDVIGQKPLLENLLTDELQ